MLFLSETLIGFGALMAVAIVTLGAIRFEQVVRRHVDLT
jgi:hypothetical protein